MASTYTIQNSISFAAGFTKLMPLSGVGGVANEPALSIANMVLQTILGPPFCWRWNRNVLALGPTVAGTQDYATAVANYGYLEKAFLAATGTGSIELEVSLLLSTDNVQSRPNYIAPQTDDGAGNITFRLLPVPDAAYIPTVIYQRKAALVTSLASTWAPIPDEYAYIYNLGFLAFSMMYANDPRFPLVLQRFLATLVGASEGLSQQQKNVFLGNWQPIAEATQNQSLNAQLGIHSRAGA